MVRQAHSWFSEQVSDLASLHSFFCANLKTKTKTKNNTSASGRIIYVSTRFGEQETHFCEENQYPLVWVDPLSPESLRLHN